MREADETRRMLSKGINFGHIFFPFEGDRALDASRWKEMESHLKESEFRRVAECGFTHVRLNLGRGLLQYPPPAYGLRPEGFEWIDRAVEMAGRQGLGIVLDMHQTPPPDLFHDSAALAAYENLWGVIADHFTGRHPTVVFELINEPRIPELMEPYPQADHEARWRTIMRGLARVIHRADPGRFVVVTGGGLGGAEDLARMGNLDIPRLFYSFHYYAPLCFTHQGANWLEDSISELRGIPYPLTRKAAEEAGKSGKLKTFFERNPNGFDKDFMRRDLRPVFEFAAREGIDLYCGGMGVYKPFAPSRDRARWVGDLVSLVGEEKVGWALWAYGSGFDLVDEKDQPDEDLLLAMGIGKSV
ncbi:MAG: glycoside hydrolase family 5 protein [bacterium]